MSMQKISATVITFNEEKKIAACLASLQGKVDETVVPGFFSTDKIPYTCKQFTLKFYRQAWRGYRQQKNDTVVKASHQFILNLDADECLSPLLQSSILPAKKSTMSGINKMNRLNIFFGYTLKHGLTYPEYILRSYNSAVIRCSPGKGHETLDVPKGSTLHTLAGDFIYSKDSLQEFTSTINQYASLSAQLILNKANRHTLVKLFSAPG